MEFEKESNKHDIDERFILSVFLFCFSRNEVSFQFNSDEEHRLQIADRVMSLSLSLFLSFCSSACLLWMASVFLVILNSNKLMWIMIMAAVSGSWLFDLGINNSFFFFFFFHHHHHHHYRNQKPFPISHYHQLYYYNADVCSIQNSAIISSRKKTRQTHISGIKWKENKIDHHRSHDLWWFLRI